MAGSPLITLSSGAQIPQLGLGVFQTQGDNVSELIVKALETGYRHFDSAHFYQNEKVVAVGISEYLKSNPSVKREDVFFTTKINPIMVSGDNVYSAATKLIAESLENTKTINYIDLFLIHFPIGGKEVRLDIYKALQDAVDTGKVKSIGVSNYGVQHLKELLEWPGLKYKPVVNQIELNPWLTRKEIVDFGREHGIEAEAFSPLTRGKRLNDPALLPLAKKYNKTTAQILIRWSLQQGYITLPKTSHEGRLAQNLDVFNFELTEEEMKELTHDDSYWVSQGYWDLTNGKIYMMYQVMFKLYGVYNKVTSFPRKYFMKQH